MSLDHYSLCPCGSGKKIKFCCSNDILPELDKVFRSIEAEQRNSALDQINHLIEFKGKRLSLLALKAELQLAKEDEEGATQTTNEFLQKDPANPLALSLATLAAAQRGDIVSAVQKLHKAFETSIERKVLHETLFQAIEGLASVMLGMGDILGARAYFLLESLLRSEDGQVVPTEALSSIDRNPNLIPLLKQEFESRDCPSTVAWRDAFESARRLFQQGFWWKACEAFEALSTQFPGQPSILYNLAVLRSRLGNMQLAQSAWRVYAQLPTVPLEEAVEAMATSRILEARNEDTVDVVRVEIPLSETERALERLLSNKRFLHAPSAIEEWDTEQGPPPKSAFLVLDRPQLANGEPLTLESIPRSLGLLFVFGRQTDRLARAEYSTIASHLDSVAGIGEAIGESAGIPAAPVTVGKTPAISELLDEKFVPPPQSDPKRLEEIALAARREALLNRWPNRSWKSLDGKRPVDVAADPAYRLRLLAEILVLEQRHSNDDHGIDFNELRAKLGLPTLAPIPTDGLNVSKLPIARLGRVPVESLNDQDLSTLLERANYFALTAVKRRAAQEAIQRASLNDSPTRLIALAALAQTASNGEEALQRYREAAALAEKLQRSPAPYLIGELQVALPMGEADRVMQLVQVLQTAHMREPGVAEFLYRVLRPFMQPLPDGRTLLRLPRRADATPAAGAPAASSGLWTPDQGSPTKPVAAPAAAPPAGKSKLWVPGMD